MPPLGFLVADWHPRASQDLTVVLYLHNQHTHIEIYSQIKITYLIIFINQILHKVFIILTTKPSCYQLTITQRIIVI
jgi:hypothetical protein